MYFHFVAQMRQTCQNDGIPSSDVPLPSLVKCTINAGSLCSVQLHVRRLDWCGKLKKICLVGSEWSDKDQELILRSCKGRTNMT